eukprot:324480-Chlamydomonas_euryale.AAC.1
MQGVPSARPRSGHRPQPPAGGGGVAPGSAEGHPPDQVSGVPHRRGRRAVCTAGQRPCRRRVQGHGGERVQREALPVAALQGQGACRQADGEFSAAGGLGGVGG